LWNHQRHITNHRAHCLAADDGTWCCRLIRIALKSSGKMRIHIVQVSRSLRWPFWTTLIALLWLALVGAAVLLSSHLGRHAELCLFKRLTGFACPTCGSTRGAMCALHGHIIQAWLYNPLLFSIAVILFVAVVARLVLGRSVKIHLTRSERIIAWILGIIIFSINWAYVICFVR